MLNNPGNKRLRLVTCAVCLLFCFAVLGVRATPAMEKTALGSTAAGEGNTPQRMVSVDFNDVDLTLFIKFISEITNRNFVVDQNVREKVTIISPSKITIKEAYQVFESVLEVYGYTTVESGQVIKIVKAVDARTKSIATGLFEEAGVGEDRLVTQIIPLTYADPEETKQLLAPLISKNGIVLSSPSTNMLIVTDIQSNIVRLQKIIGVIDVIGIGRQVTFFPLEFADAVKVVPILESVFQTPPARRRQPTDQGVKMVADERVNAVVVLASEVETSQIRQLITLLDKKVPKGKERINVYYLKNADAEELAKVLLNLPQDDAKKAAGAVTTPVVSKNVSITADVATNSLIILAERDDYLVLVDIIEKLDIPRPMVYIEVLIVEVNVDREFSLGTEWMMMGEASYKGNDGGYGGGFSGHGERGYQNIFGMVAPGVTGMGSLPAGFSLGAFGEAIKIGGVTFPNLAAIIQAYKKDKDIRILSTPQIMTTNNTEANIVIGKNIPYLTRVGTTSAAEVYSNYEYKDVGISLRIKPQINENRLIRLALSQEVTRLDILATLAADRPATLKRSIETNVIVHDGHTVVIGGLIDDSMSQVAYKVPCLGDIPLLGWFFKGVSDASEKTNLFVFLTPYVVKSSEEAYVVVEDKKTSLEKIKGDTIHLFPGPKDRPIKTAPEGEPEEAVIPPQEDSTDVNYPDGQSPDDARYPDDARSPDDARYPDDGQSPDAENDAGIEADVEAGNTRVDENGDIDDKTFEEEEQADDGSDFLQE